MSNIIKVVAHKAPYGFPESRRRTIPGYVLENGVVLLESEKDGDGSYKGGAGVDGMYLQTGQRYTPVFDDNNTPVAFTLRPDREYVTGKLPEPHLYGNIPDMLKQRPNWVCWGIRDAPPKSPYNPSSLLMGKPRPAKAGVRETWGDYRTAAECVNLGLARGIGYEFDGSGLYGVDLDHVINEAGALAPEAREIVDKLDSFSEKSPSGSGLHILVLAPGADIVRHRKKGCFLEIYNEGRYFTVTGIIYGGRKTIETRTQELQEVHDKHLLPDSERNNNPPMQPLTIQGGERERFLRIGLERDKVFAALWAGGRRNGNESADDIALMNKLAYWCNADSDAMIRAFLSSPYHAQKDEAHKKKCLRPDYLPNTAKNSCDTVYSTATVDYENWQRGRRKERKGAMR